MIEIPQAQYLVNYGELHSSSTLVGIQSVLPAIWYGCQTVSRPSGSKDGKLHGENNWS